MRSRSCLLPTHELASGFPRVARREAERTGQGVTGAPAPCTGGSSVGGPFGGLPAV